MLSAVEPPPAPFAKEFHIFAPLLGVLSSGPALAPGGASSLQSPTQDERGPPAPDHAAPKRRGAEPPGDSAGWARGRRRSNAPGRRSRTPKFCFRRLKTCTNWWPGVTSMKAPGGPARPSPPQAPPPTPDSDAAFPLSAPAERQAARPPPARGAPGRDSATHVLLHFGQVLLGEGRRGGLHGRGGETLLPGPGDPAARPT